MLALLVPSLPTGKGGARIIGFIMQRLRQKASGAIPRSGRQAPPLITRVLSCGRYVVWELLSYRVLSVLQDLWIPYFTITTDITASAMRVHTDGKHSSGVATESDQRASWVRPVYSEEQWLSRARGSSAERLSHHCLPQNLSTAGCAGD